MNTRMIDGMRTLKAVLFAALLSSCVGWTTGADAAKSFFCKATIASLGDPSPVSLSGPLVYDMGTTGSCTDLQYAAQFNLKCAGPAGSACSALASGDANFNSAAFWCAKGVPNGSTIRAYSAVGAPVAPKGRYNAAQTKGVLINKAAVVATTCRCPTGWVCNGCSPQVDGGITTDGGCKRLACQPNQITPYPRDGMPIGTPTPPLSSTSWGFSWGNAFYAWGTAANGGAPTCVTHITSPAECRWQ